MVGCSATKCPASSRAKSSIWSTPCFLAKAYTVFFCVSVGSTAALSPLRCTAVMSPDRLELTLTSLMWWRPPSLTTRTSLVSALP
jgi:hypothetical protein